MRAVHARHRAGLPDVDTEAMRTAMNGYGALFQNLVSAHAGVSEAATGLYGAEAA